LLESPANAGLEILECRSLLSNSLLESRELSVDMSEFMSHAVPSLPSRQKTLNREPGSALMARHGGQAGAALFELTDLIGDVPCYRLTPAGVEATADLLEGTFR